MKNFADLKPEDIQLVEQLLNELQAMRKYQKQFFAGNKGAMRNAIFYENSVDNSRILVAQRLGINVKDSKGQASQATLL